MLTINGKVCSSLRELVYNIVKTYVEDNEGITFEDFKNRFRNIPNANFNGKQPLLKKCQDCQGPDYYTGGRGNINAIIIIEGQAYYVLGAWNHARTNSIQAIVDFAINELGYKITL